MNTGNARGEIVRKADCFVAGDKHDTVSTEEEGVDQPLLGRRLAEIRQMANMTQSEIGYVMGISQPAVANMERMDRDLRLSSIKRYIEAIDGRIRLCIEIPDGGRRVFRV